MRVKHVATRTRLELVSPAWYLIYSRTRINAPKAASAKKVKPVISSQSWFITFPV
jgi:hypothetical protein